MGMREFLRPLSPLLLSLGLMALVISIACEDELTSIDNTPENWARHWLISEAFHLRVAAENDDYSHWSSAAAGIVNLSVAVEILDDSAQRDALSEACEELRELDRSVPIAVVVGSEPMPTQLADSIDQILDRMNDRYFGD
jgi:hypothetical protein